MECNDPDYEVLNFNLKNKEENDITNSMQHVKQKFSDTISSDLKMRQTQLETIETLMHKLRKKLHILRYGIVTSYYKNHEFEISNLQNEDGLDKQNRIHPAVKRLLGNNFQSTNNVSNRRKRKLTAMNQEKKLEELKEQKSKVEVNIEPTMIKNNKTTEVSEKITETESGIRNRNQVKKRVIVGNVSQYLPSDCKDDNTTHKWMMYLRTPNGCDNINTFVDKALFYLHHSYKPNDVIEIRSAPFHLTRRGWGEFPLRVRIFFLNELNKPVDVIHHLKLDKSHSGRQVVGNETLVDISLFEDAPALVSDTNEQLKCFESDNIEVNNSNITLINDRETDSHLPSLIFSEHSYTLKPESTDVQINSSGGTDSELGFEKDSLKLSEPSVSYDVLGTDIIMDESILTDMNFLESSEGGLENYG